jgi:hypothetical protein
MSFKKILASLLLVGLLFGAGLSAEAAGVAKRKPAAPAKKKPTAPAKNKRPQPARNKTSGVGQKTKHHKKHHRKHHKKHHRSKKGTRTSQGNKSLVGVEQELKKAEQELQALIGK